ncbi:MAG: ribosome biogenesis GTPase Der [Clostridiaceae bacterium]|nr:ribosome biogenesis GTPase Der [Clostridiaceae bacterium]
MRRGIAAIVGRPNVGKSSFFNYLAGERISIVDDTPGVTRDRIYTRVEWLDREFTLIDTGGLEPESEDVILKQMRLQAEIAMETADVIILMVDAKTGLQPADQDIADILRRSGKPVLVAVNKCDLPGDPPLSFYDFYGLGFSELFAISSAHGLGIGDLLDEVMQFFPEEEDNGDEDSVIRVAIIGKPNVGKSSLVNRMVGQDRAIVSDIPGTTRDATDTPIENEHGSFILVDTAGMRRKSRIDDILERYSIMRATAAIEKANVCVLLIDGAEGVSEQDTKIAGLAHNAGKGIVICVNKWDLPAEEKAETAEEMKRQVQETFAFMPYAEILFISAKTGKKVDQLFATIVEVAQNCRKRIPTGRLNDLIGEAQQMLQAPGYKGRRLKISYATQVSVEPPTFILFVNSVDLLHFSYERYLENQLRRAFGFGGTSIRFILREKGKKDTTS